MSYLVAEACVATPVAASTAELPPLLWQALPLLLTLTELPVHSFLVNRWSNSQKKEKRNKTSKAKESCNPSIQLA